MEIYLDTDIWHLPYCGRTTFWNEEDDYDYNTDRDYPPLHIELGIDESLVDDDTYKDVPFEAILTREREFILDIIKLKKINLVSSFALLYEISLNSDLEERRRNREFIIKNSSKYISTKSANEIIQIAQDIAKFGNNIYWKVFMRLACAIYANCDYFIYYSDIDAEKITRLLKYKYKKTNLKLLYLSDFYDMMCKLYR